MAAAMKVLETERLVVRLLTVEDAPLMRDVLNEPAFIQHVGDRGVRTEEDARRYIEEGVLTNYVQLGFGHYAVLDYARRELKLARVLAICAPDNHASIAVLRKLGFESEGLIRLPGEHKDVIIFSVSVSAQSLNPPQ